ncbi:MAG: hypothetical protein ABJA98_16025 [Acidobacteriota bacterium]
MDRDIAARFAPHFYQGLIGRERLDYITNFDFDGDWHGDNNWQHAVDTRYRLKAYVYYSVSETPTHYFIHYAAFHPRDWKGGEKTGRFLSGTIREGTTVGGTIRARGVLDDLVLSHENDLEGCLVVVGKRGPDLESARVVFVETMAHNQYLRFAPESGAGAAAPLRLDDQHPLLYVEAQGHGIEAFSGQPVRGAGDSTASPDDDEDAPKKSRFAKMKSVAKVKDLLTDRLRVEGRPTNLLVYRFAGAAEDPETNASGTIGYDLLPLYTTFWKAASTGENDSFGEAVDYGTRTIVVVALGKGGVPTVAPRQVRIGKIGSALRGVAGGQNKARPPWGWFDKSERNRPLGEWFFDPAGTVLRHRGVTTERWATAYLHQPFLGVVRDPSIATTADRAAAASLSVPLMR